jgi:hypothetical protein
VTERRTPDATLIEAVRILSRTINTDDGVIPACLAEVSTRMEELVEERRWISVGERLPDGDEEWVDIAGEWGDCVGWHDTVEWHNVLDDPCPGEVTHWKKRTPGPEGEA